MTILVLALKPLSRQLYMLNEVRFQNNRLLITHLLKNQELLIDFDGCPGLGAVGRGGLAEGTR